MARTHNAAWFAALCGLALLLLVLSTFPRALEVQARGTLLLAPVTSALHAAVRPLADTVLHAGQLQTLIAENADLRQQVAGLEAQAATLRDELSADEQSTALQAAAGNATGHQRAAVILRDPAPGRRSLIIDKGTRDGVIAGQPVLGAGATLVGIVADVQDRSAHVRLLDDPGSAVAAVVQQSRTAGALDRGSDGLQLDFVPNEAAVAAGDLVLTSPLGGRLPAGLLIGRVTEVRRQSAELFASIRVEPYADYNRLEQVLVVTTFIPDRSS